MKKKSQKKEFFIKKSQLETLQKYEDNFVMVKYSDTKLVPNQAKVLGFIRGMIKNNQKNPKMKVLNKVWMKETTKRMSFLLGIGESTLKDHIKLLEEKGYIVRDNLSVGLDNTNWYWIDENNLQNDYHDYLLKLELEVNELSKVFELDSRLPEFTNSKHENQLVCSQKMAIENPETNYAKSKLLAERALIDICKNSKMEYTIIRPPLVYDFDAPGNYFRLKNFLNKFKINPFASIKNNKRSFLAASNLVDFVMKCAKEQNARNQIFMVSDSCDISTASFVEHVMSTINRKIIIIQIPPFVINLILKIIGRVDLANSLSGDLQIDSTKAKNLMKWTPPLKIDEVINGEKRPAHDEKKILRNLPSVRTFFDLNIFKNVRF